MENETYPSHFVLLPCFQLKRVGVDLKVLFFLPFFEAAQGDKEEKTGAEGNKMRECGSMGEEQAGSTVFITYRLC